MMKKLKELYSSPNTTVLVVRFEGALLNASPNVVYGNRGAAGGDLGDENYGEF